MTLLCIDDSPTCFPNSGEYYLPQVLFLDTYTLDYTIDILIGNEWVEVYVLKEFGEHYFYDPSRFIPLTENINA